MKCRLCGRKFWENGVVLFAEDGHTCTECAMRAVDEKEDGCYAENVTAAASPKG